MSRLGSALVLSIAISAMWFCQSNDSAIANERGGAALRPADRWHILRNSGRPLGEWDGTIVRRHGPHSEPLRRPFTRPGSTSDLWRDLIQRKHYLYRPVASRKLQLTHASSAALSDGAKERSRWDLTLHLHHSL